MFSIVVATSTVDQQVGSLRVKELDSEMINIARVYERKKKENCKKNGVLTSPIPVII